MTSVVDITRLRSAVVAGRLSRDGMLEEIERQLDRTPERPIDGALELVLEHLYDSPSDPQLLRVLARLHERNGDADGAQRVLESARNVRASDPVGRAGIDDVTVSEMSLQDRLAIGRVLAEVGLLDPAREIASVAARAEPHSRSALDLLAKVNHIDGRLTETIEVWHRLRLLDPSPERALVQLAIIQHMSRDENAAGKPLVGVAPDMFNPKHEAQVELEAAFLRFRRQDIQGAVSLCDKVAARFRDTSPRLYKLAVLQKAWVLEHTGDLDGARETLELMGRERGFETDVDRLEFLGEICERLGTNETVQKAIHIYDHLNVRYGTLSALPRLVALLSASGNAERASGYEHEFERRLAVRMQKPTPVQFLRGLALYYVPLARVPRLALTPEDSAACELEIHIASDAAGRIRRRALLELMRGDTTRAEEIFRRLTRTRGASFRDHAYLGDLLALRGAADAAHAYTRALEGSEGGCIELWCNALAWTKRHGRTLQLESLDAAVVARAAQAMHERARRQRTDAASWEHLATLERSSGDTRAADRHLHKARALRDTRLDAVDIGRVAMAAVYFIGGRPRGLLHDVLAGRRRADRQPAGGIDEHDLLGKLAPDLRALVPRILHATKDYARANWPHLCRDVDQYTYTLRITKDDEPSSGSSAGLPLAVAFLSVMLDRAVPRDVALSGEIVCDSSRHLTVRPVGDAPFKILGAYHGNFRRILLPARTVEEVERAHAIPRSVMDRLVHPVSDLDEVVTAIWGAVAWEW